MKSKPENTKFKYPLADLQKEHKAIKSAVSPAIADVIQSGHFIGGPALKRFEKQFANYCQRRHCLGVGSGTAGLVMAMNALGICPGHDVLAPAFTFKSTAMAIHLAGARPALVRVKPDTGNVDPDSLERHLTAKTTAIIMVHMYGHPADVKTITEFADKHDLKIIEDACEAHGAKYNNKKTGSFGHASVFSFYPSKNLGGYGDGGAILSDDPDLIAKIDIMRGYGSATLPGYNSRLDAINAAVLSEKLKLLDKWNNRRREIASLYNSLLINLPINTPVELAGCTHVYYLYVIKTERRDELLQYLQDKGIEARIHFPKPVFCEFDFLKQYNHDDYPAAVRLSDTVLSLPMHPFLQDEDVKEICAMTKRFFELN